MEAVEFEKILEKEQIDLLLTGEGKMDGQTASGKVISGLAEVAKQYQIPTIAITGSMEGDLGALYEKGLSAAFSITSGPMSLEDSMKRASELIEMKAEQVMRVLGVGED